MMDKKRTVNIGILQFDISTGDIMANLKGIIGGELRGYTELLTEARSLAIERLLTEAKQLGADAVVGVRFTTSAITNGSSEVLAFGTAVKLAP